MANGKAKFQIWQCIVWGNFLHSYKLQPPTANLAAGWKTRVVPNNLGNSHDDWHWNFPIWTKESWENGVKRFQLAFWNHGNNHLFYCVTVGLVRVPFQRTILSSSNSTPNSISTSSQFNSSKSLVGVMPYIWFAPSHTPTIILFLQLIITIVLISPIVKLQHNSQLYLLSNPTWSPLQVNSTPPRVELELYL